MTGDNSIDTKLTDYDCFLLATKELDDSAAAKRDRAGTFLFRPKISILMPVYITGESWLRATIGSVIGQIYDKWELCITGSSSTAETVAEVLKHYGAADARIKVKYFGGNESVVGNSNEALSMASGDFVVFLECGDELGADALYEVANLLNNKPEADFIYSDEDKINAAGVRYEPFFKPDWSPDTFRSYNFICHLTAIKRCLIDEVGGFRPGYDGSQDYDLFLRAVERAHQIEHIPKILYHLRGVEISGSCYAAAKTYDFEASKKALQDHLERTGLKGEVHEGCFPGSFRVRYKNQGSPMVSIVIPTRDKSKVLKACINSITGKSTYHNYEILIVDNHSEEEDTLRYFKELETSSMVKVIRYDLPFNYSAINNYAAAHSKGEYLLFLNNDTEVISPGWMEAMLEFSQREDVGAVGALLYFPDGSIQHAGVILGIGGVADHPFRLLPGKEIGYFGRTRIIQNLSAVTGACLMMKKSIFEEIGGFDEGFSYDYTDIDLCMKIRERGYLIVYTPYAELYHHESLTRGQMDRPEKLLRLCKEVKLFFERWRGLLERGDPYYNCNLTLVRNDFSIKGIYEVFGKDMPYSLLSLSLQEEAKKWWQKAREEWQNAQDAWQKAEESGRWSAELEKRLSVAEAEANKWLQNAREAWQQVEESGRWSAELEKRLSAAEAEARKWWQNAQEGWKKAREGLQNAQEAWRQVEESGRWSADLEKRLSVAEAEARQSWQNARDVWRQVEESGRWSAELEKRLSAAEAEARQWLQNAQEALQKVEESGRKSADLEKRISVAEAETQKWLQNAQEALGKQAETNRRLMEKEQNIAALLNSRDYRLGRALNWPVRKLLSRK